MIQRIVITFLLVVCFMWMPAVGYVNGGTLSSHLLYPFCHANIFHLLGNLLCLWMLRCNLNAFVSIIIAVLCSFLPCFISEPTVGFSGVLFAMAGISWGHTGKLTMMIVRCLPFVAVTAFIPHVNFMIHTYCLFAGYLVGFFGIKDPLAKYDSYNPKFLNR